MVMIVLLLSYFNIIAYTVFPDLDVERPSWRQTLQKQTKKTKCINFSKYRTGLGRGVLGGINDALNI